MLLLMRREGEAVRINENIILEIKKISDEAVEIIVKGISEDKVKLLSPEKENTQN